MPPTTRSNGKAPPSRIYHTTPTLHQVQFPARRKVVKTYSKKHESASTSTSPQAPDPSNPSSSKPTPSASSKPKKPFKELDPRQKTLTQIDFVSSSLSELPDVEFSDSEDEKENDSPEEEDDDHDDEPVSSTKRRRAQKNGNKSKRRRTLGDQAETGRRKNQGGKNRRRTLGDAPTASAYHTQTLTQFVGRDAMMIRDSEDEDEGGFDDWLKGAESPTIRAKNHATEKSASKSQAPTEQHAEPSTPARNKTEQSIWEVPSSSQSGTPLSNRMLSRYGPADSNKPTPTKATHQEIITEAKGKAPSLVIQDSYGTASWESPSKRTPSKGTPLKDITEEVAYVNEESPSKKASQRALRGSQRRTASTRTGKENETPRKAASQRSQQGTPTPGKKRSPKKLASGLFEIPDSDEDEGGFSDSDAEGSQCQFQAKEDSDPAPQDTAAAVITEQPVVFGDPSEVLGQDTYVENADTDAVIHEQAPVGTQASEQFSRHDEIEHCKEAPIEDTPEVPGLPIDTDEIQEQQSAAEDDCEMPSSAAAEGELFTHVDKTQQGETSIVDYGLYSSAPTPSKPRDEASCVVKTQQLGTIEPILPPNSPATTEQFTHPDKPQEGHEPTNPSSPASSPAKQNAEASYVDKTQQQESVKAMLPPSSAVTDQLTHVDKTQRENESLVNLGFSSSAPQSLKQYEASYIDKTQQQEILRSMLPPSSAVTSEQFTHIDKTQQRHEVPVSYDFEAFPAASAVSTQEEEPYTHVDKTQQTGDEAVSPRAHVRFLSTPAIIPSPEEPVPLATEDRVPGTQDTEDPNDETPFATAKEIAIETNEQGSADSRPQAGSTEDTHRQEGEGKDDDYAGAETQFVWKEIESSKEDPFQSTTTSRERTSSAETPQTSPQLPTPKAVSAQKSTIQKPLRKPLRHLPPSSQTQPLESQRIPLATIQAMGHPTGRSDIILPVPTSSLAPLVSGHSLHLSLPFKAPAQVARFWLFENREVLRYGVIAELENEVVDDNGRKSWQYFIPQVFELNNERDEEELLHEGFIWKAVDRYSYLDPGPVAQLLSNLRQALFSPDGEEETQTQLTEIEEEEEEATQHDEAIPMQAEPSRSAANPASSFSVSQAAEAQLLSEQATHADEVLCPSTPLKERPSAPPPPSTNPIIDSTSQAPPNQPSFFIRPSQATTASQTSTPEKPSQYLPPQPPPPAAAAGTPTKQRRVVQQQSASSSSRRMPAPEESSSSHLTFPESDSSPPFLIPLSQAAGGLTSSQLLTKSQMLPDSLVRDEGGWDDGH